MKRALGKRGDRGNAKVLWGVGEGKQSGIQSTCTEKGDTQHNVDVKKG